MVSTSITRNVIALIPFILNAQICSSFTPSILGHQKVTASTSTTSSLLSLKSSEEECRNNDVDRRSVLQKFMAVTSTSFALLQSQSKPAFAERSLTTITESYRRYVPRMETGFSYLATDVKEIIENGDKNAYNELITELSAEKGTKISAMKGTMNVSVIIYFIFIQGNE